MIQNTILVWFGLVWHLLLLKRGLNDRQTHRGNLKQNTACYSWPEFIFNNTIIIYSYLVIYYFYKSSQNYCGDCRDIHVLSSNGENSLK